MLEGSALDKTACTVYPYRVRIPPSPLQVSLVQGLGGK